jgi:hypothetical protein
METIQELIDKALIRPGRVRSGCFSPSSFGQCFRQQYWNRKDEPKSNPPDERSLRVFAAGQLFHNFVQDIMRKDNTFECEIKIDTQPDILGFADMVGENEVIDIKSQHSKSFWWMTKKNADIKKEKYSNWLQVGYYARELKKKFMRLVFVSKDDLCIQEYVQPLDNYWEQEIETEIVTLRNLWRMDVLPSAKPRCDPKTNKKTQGVTYWQCTYCAFETKCHQIEKEAGRVHPSAESEVEDE